MFAVMEREALVIWSKVDQSITTFRVDLRMSCTKFNALWYTIKLL